MQIITINIPIHYMNALQKLEENKIVKSRSDAVRQAIGNMLKKDLEFINALAKEGP